MARDPERILDKRQLLRFVDPRFLEIFDECVKELTPHGLEVAARAPQDLLRIVEEAWYAELGLDLAAGVDRRPLAEPVSATKPIGSKKWTYVDHLELVEAVEAARKSKGSLNEAFEAVQRLEEYRHL